jgi:hypothetical protein
VRAERDNLKHWASHTPLLKSETGPGILLDGMGRHRRVAPVERFRKPPSLSHDGKFLISNPEGALLINAGLFGQATSA